MGAIDLSQCFLLSAANSAEAFRIPLVGRGVVGIKFNRFFELRFSSGKVPVVPHLVAAQHGVEMSQRGIQLQRFAGGGIRLRILLVWIPSKVRHYRIGVGQRGIGQSVVGVFGDGLIEIGNCRLQICQRSLVPEKAAF
jgi:hypothetical protein